ncbi:MAG: hypothetical protein RLZZ458_1521 [Planctomycetota bacterium]|jgi:chemotaxis protein histidine kinase CheA
MNQPSPALALLLRVQRRLTIVKLARSLHFSLIAAVAVGCLLVLVVRLGGLLPPEQQPIEYLLIGLPLAAAVLAWLISRKADASAAARIVDRHARTDDLFLTFATLSSSAGDYQPLVQQSAVQAAERIQPDQVVPFRPNRPIGIQAVLLTVFALMLWFLPTFDPFGRVEAATRVEQQKTQLQQSVESIRRREQKLSQKLQQAEQRSGEIEQKAQEMMTALRKMKPEEKRPNSQVLKEQQQQLNQLWSSVSSDSLREMLAKNGLEMQSGEQSRKMNEWLRDLQQGNPESLKKELEKARESMQAMLNANSPEERSKAASELRKQLQDLKKFSSKKAGSKELEDSLNQALKALESLAQKKSSESSGEESSDEASSEELAQQAREALQESLELARKELEDIARSAEDIQKIEQALKTLQQAEKLNQQGQMDGEQCEGCKSIADYAARLRKMQENGEGEGQNGQGGRGGMMEEDGSDPEGYKDEKTRTQITAGKLLLSIRTKEAATEKDFDPEELRNYQNSVTELRSGVQAAIEAEEIPPGYVDGIKQYFDNIENAPAAPARP